MWNLARISSADNSIGLGPGRRLLITLPDGQVGRALACTLHDGASAGAHVLGKRHETAENIARTAAISARFIVHGSLYRLSTVDLYRLSMDRTM